jgi:hypothetical protein
VRKIFKDGLLELWLDAYLQNWEHFLSPSELFHGGVISLGLVFTFLHPFVGIIYLATYFVIITMAYKYFYWIYVQYDVHFDPFIPRLVVIFRMCTFLETLWLQT